MEGVSACPTIKSTLLANSANELERLRLQARVWEPEVEIWLDSIGVQPGWRCLDMGCGAMGVLGPLSRRVGSHGSVVGLDRDVQQLAAARAYVSENRLANVEIVEADAYASSLPSDSFDFVHARFLIGPAGRADVLLPELQRVTKPGGIIGLQEPDTGSWTCYPPDQSWDALKSAILTAFRKGGGDLDSGRHTFAMLRRLGLENVKLRAATIALQDGHPYMRLPIQFAASLRPRIVGDGLMSEQELDASVAQCEKIAADPDTIVISFIVTQVFGRKPQAEKSQ